MVISGIVGTVIGSEVGAVVSGTVVSGAESLLPQAVKAASITSSNAKIVIFFMLYSFPMVVCG